MKILTASLLGLMALSLRGEPKTLGHREVPRPQLIECWGWTTAQTEEMARIEIKPAELDALVAGAAANLEGRLPPADLQKAHGDVERLAEARHAKLKHAIEAENVAKARVTLARRAKEPGVHPLEGKDLYEIVQPGSGAPPKPKQTLTLHYTGWLLDGSEFTQLGPYDVVLVPNRLAPAMFAGVQKIGRGGVVRVYVMPPLPPGDDLRLGILPGSGTIYQIELIDIKPTAPGDLANSLLPPAPEPVPPLPSGLPESTLWQTWGWIVAQKSGAAAMHFPEAERAAWLHGLAAGIRGEPALLERDDLEPSVRNFVYYERLKVRIETQVRRHEERDKLFAELRRNPAVVAQADGLRYEIVESGEGAHPKTGDMVVVEYTGRLCDGMVFDRTDNEPLHIEIGSVIAGLNEGLQLIGRGGRIKLYVPPDLGYGSENMSGVLAPIPADSVLLYDIQLREIQPASGGK